MSPLYDKPKWEEWDETVDPDRIFIMPCKVGEYYWLVCVHRTDSGKRKPLHIRRCKLTVENFGRVAFQSGTYAFSTRKEAAEAYERMLKKWWEENG